MPTPPAAPRSVHWIVLLRPMRKTVPTSGLRSVSSALRLTLRVMVSADCSRREPSAARALPIAVLTRSPSADARIVITTNASAPGAIRPKSQVTTVPIEHAPCDGRADITCVDAGGVSITRVSVTASRPSLAARTTNVHAASPGDPVAGPASVTEKSDDGARGVILGRRTNSPCSMPFTTTEPLEKNGYDVHAPLNAGASSAG